ncbi:hypothetical protein [Alteromonas gracilis]|uniref:Uncharacterized protein n=1 Tax=Alteromonas gracilis TaxID=1479524 RepID=A0ABX5CJ86_9ALTE|nr:hypothetical protein [Alteromonas gracilis]PRO67629.1 hypothetical protein C6Y39_18310 [Alteromonas gracilis]
MKTWLAGLIIFALIAGYKVFSYQHQLSESNAEKERLTSVLDRSRVTETSELKVMKPATKLVAGGGPGDKQLSDNQLSDKQLSNLSYTGSKQHSALSNGSIKSSRLPASDNFYSETEGSLTTFFLLPPNNERFVLSSVKCENGLCELVGEYDGSEAELSSIIEALEREPWWHFGKPIIATEFAQRGLKLNVSFAAEHLPHNDEKFGNEMQAELNQKVASAG